MKFYKYAHTDTGSAYRDGGKDGKPLLLRPGKLYPEDKFDPAFLKRLIEDKVIIPVEE